MEWTSKPVNSLSMACDVLVVGGGPAGIAAAVSAAQAGQQVILVDDNPTPGGQIWRGGQPESPLAAHWLQQLAAQAFRSFLW